MPTIITTIIKVATSTLLNMLMKFATEEVFKEVFISLAEMGAKSTKTKYDDKIVAKAKEILNSEEK